MPVEFLRTRSYGSSGPLLVVLHGGPGAPGYMAPVARRLAERFRVLEPLQRGSGDHPLTVERHVSDLHELIESRCAGERPALVGHSWGAMLALAYAAEHPGRAESLVLIGCGTFDRAARNRMMETRSRRWSDRLQRRIERIEASVPDPDERLDAIGNLILPLYSHQLITPSLETESCDARAGLETWDDMVRLQDQGVYPAAFEGIDLPVLMLHGTVDPHPGRMIRASLERRLPQLEYREWDRCGHYPWLERFAHEAFFAFLIEWLER